MKGKKGFFLQKNSLQLDFIHHNQWERCNDGAVSEYMVSKGLVRSLNAKTLYTHRRLPKKAGSPGIIKPGRVRYTNQHFILLLFKIFAA